MTIAFCSHKDISNLSTVRAAVNELLRGLVAEGADYFLLGGYGGFDSLAAHTVYDLKRDNPQIHSTLVIPYLNRDYDTKLYDDSTYPPLEGVPLKFAISKRTERMVDQADIVVAYVKHSWGGAAATLRYAETKKKRIIRI